MSIWQRLYRNKRWLQNRAAQILIYKFSTINYLTNKLLHTSACIIRAQNEALFVAIHNNNIIINWWTLLNIFCILASSYACVQAKIRTIVRRKMGHENCFFFFYSNSFECKLNNMMYRMNDTIITIIEILWRVINN